MSAFTSLQRPSTIREPSTPPLSPLPMRSDPRFEAAAHPLASRQHGIVTRQQLLDAGLPAHIVDQRVRSGRIRAVHRGVYRIDLLATSHSPFMAACLACGRTALVSHRSAGLVWGLLLDEEPGELIHVSGPNLVRRRPGIRVHRCPTLCPADRTRRSGLPVTTAARTIVDLAADLTDRELERVLAVGRERDLVRPKELRAAMERARRKPGMKRLRRVLASGRGGATASVAEELVLGLIRAARLPDPVVHASVAGLQVDFFWPDARLVLEVDGFEFHSSREAFNRDRGRDRRLVERGYRVIRTTWEEVTDDPGALLTSIVRILRRD